MTTTYTTNRGYPKPGFDAPTWHTDWWRALDMIDLDVTSGAGSGGGAPPGTSVSTRQMRQALVNLGSTQIYVVDSAIPADIANPINMEWLTGQFILQGGPLSDHIKTQLGYTDAQMTTLFAQAAALPR